MVAVKVWLGGEGPSELGTRADGGDEPGVIEALLVNIEPRGWVVDGAQRWKYIRKYRAGHALRGGANHEDIHNLLGLALSARDAGCEILAFTRDVDADEDRAAAIARGIALATDMFDTLVVVGGVARPAIEGWILACARARDSDSMSRARTLAELRGREIDAKSAAAYVAIVEACDLDRLPPGCASLSDWISNARTQLGRVIRGA
jgi:hypothetical protein